VDHWVMWITQCANTVVEDGIFEPHHVFSSMRLNYKSI
jgi:hypothetical protein